MKDRKFGEVVELTYLKTKKNSSKDCTCTQPMFVIDETTELVNCERCGAIMSPLRALKKLAKRSDHANELHRKRMDQFEAAAAHKPHNIFFYNYENMVEKKKGLPKCPHCNQPFMVEQIVNWGPFQWAKKHSKALIAKAKGAEKDG